jgi:RNA polymerase sigma-70 factor, ECF subfamily
MGRHAAGWTAPGSPGTAQAFQRLVEPHLAALRAYVLRFTEDNEAVADSIVKETLYRLAQDPRRYPQRPSAVRPWLVLTARNVLHDGERHAPAGHDDRPFPLLHEARTAGPGDRPPLATIVALMKDLPATDRELIVELVYRGVSLEAAAADRGLPVETIKSRLYYAMRALRTLLDRHAADRRDAQ